MFSGLLQSGGGLAEYVVAPTSTTVKRPHYISAIDGAALGVSAFAALQSVRNSADISLDGRKQEPKNLLITNGSGGVGSLAVQVPFCLLILGIMSPSLTMSWCGKF